MPAAKLTANAPVETGVVRHERGLAIDLGHDSSADGASVDIGNVKRAGAPVALDVIAVPRIPVERRRGQRGVIALRTSSPRSARSPASGPQDRKPAARAGPGRACLRR